MNAVLITKTLEMLFQYVEFQSSKLFNAALLGFLILHLSNPYMYLLGRGGSAW